MFGGFFFPFRFAPALQSPGLGFVLLTLSGTSNTQPCAPTPALPVPFPFPAHQSISLGCPIAPEDLPKSWKAAPNGGVNTALGFCQVKGRAG